MKTKGELRGGAFWGLCTFVGFLVVVIGGLVGAVVAMVMIGDALKPTFAAVPAAAIWIICILLAFVVIYWLNLSDAKERERWAAIEEDDPLATARRKHRAKAIKENLNDPDTQ
jgi:uncharacterized membrane protein YhaH (DUF805 family)